jgi:alpha-N-arabinofuranosidase
MNVAGGSGTVGFSNPGWWGIDVKVEPYKGSFYARGSYSGSFTASLLSASNTVSIKNVHIGASRQQL